MYKQIYLITNKDNLINDEISSHLEENYKLNYKEENYKKTFEDITSLFLLNLNDEEIKIFFKNHLNTDINIGILPNEHCPNAISNYSISKNIKDAIDDAFNEKLQSKVDLLICNETIAFNKIEIGDMHGINCCYENSYLTKFKNFISNLKNISFKSYTFTTSKEHSFDTVASGIIILEHSVNSDKSALSDNLSIHDGKLNAFVLSPTSLISYIWYLITIFFYHKVSVFSLPKSLGFIKSSSLSIDSNEDFDYIVDGTFKQTTNKINVEVIKDSINLHLGRQLEEKILNENKTLEEKDNIKVKALPKGELKEVLLNESLPLFKKASDDDLKDLFLSLNSSAKFSYIFLTLMVLSTLIATTGLFANSSPVIIGAMILAPLMSPIISFSMGIIRANEFLVVQSLRTLFLGVLMALFVSAVFTLIIPLNDITNEMQGRLNPNLLDLFVALFSGIAGAYASSKEEIAKSLAGVAIAVALVPPLSVTGIGIGYGDFNMVYGSFLLFITNLVGISLSAAITFIILGYSPIKKAKKGLLYTSLLLVLIAIPLVSSFSKVIEKNNYISIVDNIKHININEKVIELNLLDIENKNEILYLNMEVISDKTIDENEYKKIKILIEDKLGKKSVLNITPKLIVK